MATNGIKIIGLPSEGLEELAGSLEAPHLESDEIRRACDDPDEARSITAERIFDGLSGQFDKEHGSAVLLVYQTPWNFLERQLRKSESVPLASAQLEYFAADALKFWHDYHASLMAMRHKHDDRCLLLNGDRTFDTSAVAALVEMRFRLQPRVKQSASAPARHKSHTGQEESYWQVVDRLAPGCLELYGLLEACAELMGRRLEPGFEQFPKRDGPLAALLGPELKSLSRAEQAKLYVLQLAQVQEELERCFDARQTQDREVAELRRQLELRFAPALWSLARRTLAPESSAAGFLTSSAVGRWLGDWKRKHALKRQAATIRASSLFDEKWYLETYPDVAEAGIDPVEHYLMFGVADRRNPSSQFDTRWYLETHADVAKSGMNPLLHYVEFGRGEGRSTRAARAAMASRRTKGVLPADTRL